ETGSGKSVCLNVILSSIIFRYSPDEVKLLLIDLKEVEMAPYAGLPHMLLKEPLSSIPEIVNALKWIREEVVGRFTLFKSLHIRNLTEYNNREGVEKLPRIVIIIDEASELMSDPNARKTLESTLNSLARIARAAGIHLIFATQNPVKTVITNEIQNNLNTKIAFAVGDYVHSQVIFKAKGAECLLGRGDMYIKRGQEMRRAQCALITTSEIEEAAAYIRENNEYDFNEAEIEKILNGNAGASEELKNAGSAQTVKPTANTSNAAGVQTEQEPDGDANEPDLNWQALKICVDANYVSCSYLQRKLKRGYNTVANILEELAAEGYLSSVPQGSKEKREILISKEDFYREWAARYGADEDAELENFDRNGD
ncbi:MAG: FtsK/SpoIIIE domain-containing protein, partial [Christensenellales bacterium]